MPDLALPHRLAEDSDVDAIRALMEHAINAHLAQYLDPAAVAASHDVMGLDTQLIADRTYFLIEDPDRRDRAGRPWLVGCGGWSRRKTAFGGDHFVDRDDGVLDPAVDAARIRAMYTDPDYARRGVGRAILALCEDAARAAGFTRAELVATISGEPLYEACGYAVISRAGVPARGLRIPTARMVKTL